MTILISLAVCIVGAMVYGLSRNPKLVEMGRIALFCGLLTFLLQLGPETVRLLKG